MLGLNFKWAHCVENAFHIVDQQFKEWTKMIFCIVLCNLILFLHVCPMDLPKWLQFMERVQRTAERPLLILLDLF